MSETKTFCPFDKAWIGRCNKPTGEDGFCEEHTGLKCCGCGVPAVRECDHTGIQFVCGLPLCANCTHLPPKEGEPNMFMLGGGHGPIAGSEELWAAYRRDFSIRMQEARVKAEQDRLEELKSR